MLRLPVNRLTYALLVVLLPASVVLWLAPSITANLSSGAFVLLIFGSLVLSVGAFASLCAYCRCRFCGYKLFWHAVGERDHSDSLGWFFTADECPRCARSRDGTATPSDSL